MSEGVSLPIEGDATPRNQGDAPIQLTEIALQKVRELLKREAAEGHGLRIGVTGGGCSGMQYQLGFEPGPKPDDLVLELDGVLVFVDAASQPHLAGLTLDYVTGLNGAGFKFLNPNATRTCGCGTSFAV